MFCISNKFIFKTTTDQSTNKDFQAPLLKYIGECWDSGVGTSTSFVPENVLFLWMMHSRQKNLLGRLQSVSYETFHTERQRWSLRLIETTKRRRFRRNPAKYLKETENKYCELIGQS